MSRRVSYFRLAVCRIVYSGENVREPVEIVVSENGCIAALKAINCEVEDTVWAQGVGAGEITSSVEENHSAILVKGHRGGLDFAGRIEPPPLSIDFLPGTATLSGKVISLPQKELQLRCCLVLSAGKRVSAKSLYRRIWGTESVDYLNSVGTIASRLCSRLWLDEGSPFALTATRTGEREYLFSKVRFD